MKNSHIVRVNYLMLFFILGGDFNVSINNYLDRFTPKKTVCSNPALLGLIDKFALVDIWRERLLTTWSLPGPTKMVQGNLELID